MLYDPKWEQQTKADPFELSSLIAWLEKQPADTAYCYISNGECLLQQYFTSHGYIDVLMSTSEFGHTKSGDRQYEELPPSFNHIALETPHTFGAALQRAKAVQF